MVLYIGRPAGRIGIKTALNLVLKLGSKRPEITAKKFNDYVEAIKPKAKEVSKLDAGIVLDEDDLQPIDSKKKITLRSTPKAKEVIKKLIPTKLYNWFVRANIRATTTYEKTNKNRITKSLHTHYHDVQMDQNINKMIVATSKCKHAKYLNMILKIVWIQITIIIIKNKSKLIK